MLIVLGHPVLAQALHDVLGVRHRLDAGHVHGLHLLDHSEDAVELLQNRIGFRLVDGNPGEARGAFYVVAGEGHERGAS